MSHLLLGHHDGVTFQRVAQDVAAHALAGLKVEVLKKWREVFELQDHQQVVVGVHRDLQEAGQFFRHGAAGCYAARRQETMKTQSSTVNEGLLLQRDVKL